MKIACSCAGFTALLFIFLAHTSCGSGKTSDQQHDTLSRILKHSPQQQHADSVEADFRQRIQKIPAGDLNHDGSADTITVFPPRYIIPGNPLEGCVGDTCSCTVRFSCHLPDIQKVTGTGLYFSNIGDLDGDGIDELAFIPQWPTSVWQALYVYSFRMGKWTLQGEGSVNISALDSDPQFIKKHIRSADSRHFVILSDSLGADTDSLFRIPRIFTLK
jgi:hypothetical protein